MERHEILEAMGALKLYGMRANFDEIAGKGLARRDEVYPLIAGLIRAERTHRQARSVSYRIGGARFPMLKDLDADAAVVVAYGKILKPDLLAVARLGFLNVHFSILP